MIKRKQIAFLVITPIAVAAALIMMLFYQVIFTMYESNSHLLLYATGIIVLFLLDYLRVKARIRAGKPERAFYIFMPSLILLTGFFLCYTMVSFYTGLLLMIAGMAYYTYSMRVYWNKEDISPLAFWRKMILAFTLLIIGYALCLKPFLYFLGIPIAIFGYILYVLTRNSCRLGERKLFRRLNVLIPVTLGMFTLVGLFGNG